MSLSRRSFVGASAAVAAPAVAAAQAVGVRHGDLGDLTIKEVRVYHLGNSQITGIVTASGIEGNYTLGARYWHPKFTRQQNRGWGSSWIAR